MKLRKNLGAKIAAATASLAALIGVWGLVHNNPPASARDSGTASAAERAASNAPRADTATANSTNASARRHTRTHVS